MIRMFLSGILIFGFCRIGSCTQKLSEAVHFASKEKSQMLLSREDDFTDRWSTLDIDIRMQSANADKKELLEYIPTQAMDWEPDELSLLESILSKCDSVISKHGYQLHFPDTIYFLKTTLDEEFSGASGYTRSNYVILNGDKVDASNPMIAHVVVHELFHILSRSDPDFRSKMYNVIGFEIMEEIQLPDELSDVKLTNPDAPYSDSYIRLGYQGESVECMMINYSDKSYTEGNIMDYVKIGFLKLSNSEPDEETIIYDLTEVSGFFEQVGKNTNYIINPEEIAAENFTVTILGKENLPNPEIVEQIKLIMTE